MRYFRVQARIVSLVMALSAAHAVSAADLPQEPVVVPDYVQDWTGFYLGAFVGAGGIVNDISLPGVGVDFNGVGGEGFFGGVMAGYNYQMTSQLLIGLEAEIGLSDLTTDVSTGGFNLDAQPEWFWAVSARLGWLPSADTMLYVIGGYSYADYNVDISVGGASASFSEDYSGFHVGTGMETRVSNRLSARVEYRYTQYGGEDWGTAGSIDVEPSSHTGRLALAYNLYDFGGSEVAPAAGYAPASWTGVYAGLYGEAGAVVDEISVPGFSVNGIGGEGLGGGLTVGYDHQFGASWVAGIQGEIGLSDITTELSGPGFSAEAGADWTASLSARLGWLAHPETMLYVIGGYSYADVSIDVSGVPISIPSEDFHGFHVGAGMETYLSQNITARVEYRYTQYGDEDFGTGFINVEPSAHTGRLGIAYKFGL